MEDLLDSKPATYNPAIKNKLLVDIWMQAVIFTVPLLSLLLIAVSGEDDYIVPAGIFYSGMGSFQLISSLIHLTYKQKNPLYRAYYIQLFVHLFIILNAFAGGGIVSMLALLFLTPLTAIYYFMITIVTYNQLK